MPGINADRRMLPRCNIAELHGSKRRRATRHRHAVKKVKVTTENGTVGNAADAVETRHSNRAAQRDGADYVDVSRANDNAACTAKSITSPTRGREFSNAFEIKSRYQHEAQASDY
jgi:hypothetical protein